MTVTIWLQSLGLEKYEKIFLDNAIGLTILPDLTEGDLEKLGVLLGHRKTMLRAIAALSTSAPQSVSGETPRRQRESAERRHLTVPVCGLAAATELSSRL